MLDLMKRLAELDAGNPRVYNDTPTLNHQGVAEDDAGDVEKRMIAKIEKEKQRLAKLKHTDPEAYKREMAKSKTSSRIPPVSIFEEQSVAEDKDVDEEKADEGPEILKIKSDQAKAKGEKSFNVGNKTFPVKEGDDEQVEECGMMPMGAMSGMSDHHHTPASINISADSGDELSAMLRDIMTLAGRDHHDHADDIGMAEPAGDLPPPAEVDTDGGDDMGMDEPTMMRSMIDKLNPGDDEGGDQGDDDSDDVKEYDNTPNPETSGYANMTPTGNDMNSKGDSEASKVNGGGNPYTRTMEQVEHDLFAEYRKFVGE